MNLQDILTLPIDTVLLKSGDRTLLQLYRESEEFFTQVVSEYHTSPDDMLEHTISFIEQLSGKKYNTDKIPSTMNYIRGCIDYTSREDLVDCLRGSVIRLILISDYGSRK